MVEAKRTAKSPATVIKTIPITKARNQFFALVSKSYRNGKIYRIKKSGIPVAFIVPADAPVEELLKKRDSKGPNRSR